MTSTFPDITISTDRLMLRAFEEADAPMLAELVADEHITAWMGAAAGFPAGADEALDWAVRQAADRRAGGTGAIFAAVEFLTHRLVGFVEVTGVDWRSGSVELAFAIGPWARGEGYAAEAVLAVAQWLFEDQKFERVELRTAAGNTSAQQVAQKVGCISEGVLRSAALVRLDADGESRTDVIVWGLLPEDLDGITEAADLDGAGRPQFAMWD